MKENVKNKKEKEEQKRCTMGKERNKKRKEDVDARGDGVEGGSGWRWR
jgi:hypothetical protein